jgi:hypothetical protein
MMIPEEGVFCFLIFSSFRIIMTFFLLHASSVVGRLLFQGNNGIGHRAVKVFQKNTTRRCGDFFENPKGLTLTAR